MPPPPGLRKWQQPEHLSEMKWGGKQKWRRERWQSELSAGKHAETNIQIVDNSTTQDYWQAVKGSGALPAFSTENVNTLTYTE